MISVILSILLVLFAGYVAREFFKFRDDRINVVLLMVVSIGFYYGMGTFLGLVVAPVELRDILLGDAGLSQGGLMWPLVLIFVYSLLTFFIARSFPSLSFGRREFVNAVEAIMSKKANLWLFLGLCGVEAYLIYSGKVAFGGVQTEDVDSYRIAPLALLTVPASYAAIIIAGYGMYADNRSFWMRCFYRGVFTSQFAFVLMGGRRLAAVALALAFFGLCISGVSRRKIAIVSVVFSFVFVSAFCLFFALRVAGYSDELVGLGRFDAVKGQISRLDRVLNETGSERSFGESLRENVATRPFIIGYFGMLCNSDGVGSLGGVLKVSAATAIPSFIWRGKDGILAGGGEEYLAYEAYGLPRLTDEANTIITSGYTELALVGPMIFVVISLLFIGGGVFLFRLDVTSETKLIVFASFFVLCLNLEEAYAVWFVGLRSILIWTVLLFVWGRMFPDSRIFELNRSGKPRTVRRAAPNTMTR